MRLVYNLPVARLLQFGGGPLEPASLFTFDAKDWQREPLAAFDSFLTHRRVNGRRLRPSSFVIYRGMLIRLLAWLAEQGQDLQDLDASAIDAFLATRVLSPESRHRYLLTFTELYQHLAVLRDAEANPARELLTQQRAPDRLAPEALTPAEVVGVLTALRATWGPGWKARRLVAMVCLILGAGLRTKELLGLRRRDVDEKTGTVWVVGHRPRPERTVPLRGIAGQAASLWLAQLRELALPGELLFPGNLAGAPLAASTLFRQVQSLLAKAEVTRRYEGPMLLRNTRGAAWLADHERHKVQLWMGHELERTTEQLAQAAPAWAGCTLLDDALALPQAPRAPAEPVEDVSERGARAPR